MKAKNNFKIHQLLIVFSFIGFSNLYAEKNVDTTSRWRPKYQENLLKNKNLTNQKSNSPKVQTKNEIISKSKNETTLVLSDREKQDLMKLREDFSKPQKSSQSMNQLKSRTLNFANKAVPVLINVMKNSSFPEKNRWVATFLLGRIMGKKASAYIAQYCSHPEFMMRLAALKTLMAIKEDRYKGLYAKMLNDKALIVRIQALENINYLKINSLAPYVWKMLYDKENYTGTVGSFKRGDIIREAIKTVGALKFEAAQKPMLEMFQKEKYRDVYSELDSSLQKISGKSSPSGDLKTKQHFWKRYSVAMNEIR